MGKICSILLILALVLSFSVVATPVSAQQYAELTVNITAPADNADIMGGVEFTVSANVTNNGTALAKNVKVAIEISGNASLKTGQTVTKSLPTPYSVELPVDAWAVVSWDLVCTDGGSVDIKVTPSGGDPITGNPIKSIYLHSGTVSINQKKVLEVTIVAPPNLTAFNVTQGFNVTANVENISSLNATEVKLTLSIDRYADLKAGEVATMNVGILNAKTSANYTWALKCTGDGFSRITVSPSGEVESTAIPAAALTPATVTVKQGIFTVGNITLVKGWNLISLPLIPLDSDIEVVLAGIMDDVTSVWYWDAATGPPWKSFAPGAPFSLLTMEDGKAYWIDMEAAQTLKIAGTEMPKGGGMPHDYDVVVGWNMVGFKSTAVNKTVENYLAGTEYIRIYYFENGTWYSIPGTAYNTTYMVPGCGYWVAFTEPGTIYP